MTWSNHARRCLRGLSNGEGVAAVAEHGVASALLFIFPDGLARPTPRLIFHAIGSKQRHKIPISNHIIPPHEDTAPSPAAGALGAGHRCFA